MGEGADAAHDACKANRDISHERQAALDKMVMDAVARETTQITVMFMTILKEQATVSMPTSLKVTSVAAGIKAMSPLTGQGMRLSTRDGNSGQKRLDTPLM